MYYPPRDGWKNLEQAHRMGVSWGQIWALIGAVVAIAVIGFGVAVFVGRQNAKMVEQKIQEGTKNAESSQINIQKDIQDEVNQKLRDAGVEPAGY